MLIAKRILLRCFLEGKEIPVIGASVQTSVSSTAIASIQVVYLKQIKDLKPKTLVHLFFYDAESGEYEFSNLKNYKLLFTGLLIEYQIVETPISRNAVLQCADFTINWDICYQYMITYGPNGNFLTPEGANYGAGDTKFNNIIDGHSSVLLRYLSKTPLSPGLQNLKGLLGGIVSFIEAFGGVDKHTAGVNDFFAIEELRTHVLQQIVAEQNDNTARSLFDEKHFMEWLERGVTTLGELCRLSDMINLLFKYIYYEYVNNVTPMYVPGSAQKGEINNLGAKINNDIEEIHKSLIDDKDLEAIIIRSNNSISVIRVLLNLSNDNKQKENLDNALNNLYRIIEQEAYSKTVANLLTQTKKLLKNAITKDQTKKQQIQADRLNSFIFKPECYFVAPPRCCVIFPEHRTQFSFSRNFINEITRLRLQSGMAFIGNDKLLADFCYAPSRQEIKQFAKEQGTYGVRALLPWEKYTGIQPKFEYINEINYIANKRQKELQKTTVRQISGGINKKTNEENVIKIAVSLKQKAANFNFLKHRFAGRRANISMAFNPYLVTGFPSLVLTKPFFISQEEIKKIADEQGFELNTITDDSIVKNIDKFAALLDAPEHYLGYIAMLNHSIDQSGGVTSCTLTHCRTHSIDDDYLKLQQSKVMKVAGKEVVQTYLDIHDLIRQNNTYLIDKMIDFTYQNIEPSPAENVKVESVLDIDLNKKTNDIEKRPKLNITGIDVISPNFRTKSNNKGIDDVGYTIEKEISDGKIKVPTQYGKIIPGQKGLKGGTIKEIQVVNDTLVDVKDGKRSWKTLIIYEEITSKEILKPIPLEEVIRPNWFSPLYSNLYIGEHIYTPFFGTGSVVDQLIFSSPQGVSLQGFSNREDILAQLKTINFDENSIVIPNPKLYDIPSVETAANILAFQYGQAIKLKTDVNKFVHNYTYRPIATMLDIFGTEDLEYRKTGNKLELVSGTPGFHSTSVAPFGELLGLMDNPDLGLPSRFGDKNRSKISKSDDMRLERQRAVEDYVIKLRSTESVIGLEG